VVDLEALTRPVRVSARPIAVPARAPGDIVRLSRALTQPVVLTGQWAAGEVVLAADPIHVETGAGEPFEVLDRQPPIEGGIPDGAVAGGWFGWIGFQPSCHALGFYPNVLRRRRGQWWDEALVGIVDDDALEGRRRALRELVQSPAPDAAPYELGPVAASRDRTGHVVAVERCMQHIRAGEIYQANICLTLRAAFTGSAADLGADLVEALRPPYGAYVGLGDRQVASASPELFLRRAGRRVMSRPIKGTRPRAGVASGAEARRLAGSQKDRAENVMIVDLVRNDLSRVAEVGSVRVSGLLDVVAHPGVWHLVSTVEARLRAAAGDADLLRATFPPGSVSGAPKRRAVEVIAELEDGPRGVYTGAIGYVSPAAGAELSVAIRTAQVRAGGFSLGVGGGITVDSTPIQEWWECFDKAWPLLGAIGGRVADPTSRRSEPDPRAGAGVCDTSLLRRGAALERAEHLARLERAVYELYQQPVPPAAARALLQIDPGSEPWQRQRVDVAADGAVRVTRAPVAAPLPARAQAGLDAVVVASGAGFGAYKWADRRRQQALEAAHPGRVVILGGPDGLLETTRANVVAVAGDRLVTAPLDGRILPGVTRTVVLELARDLGVDIELAAPDPRQAQALAVVSSVAGLRWIRRCDELRWDDPGELLRELSRRLVERWACGVTVRG
jgi:para-aminobenzoate synthetase / 4-amino-4-deoxychorismate lyase